MNFVALMNAIVGKYNNFADSTGKAIIGTMFTSEKIMLPCKVTRIVD